MNDSSSWVMIFTKVLNIYATTIFAILWFGFLLALLINQDWLSLLWSWVQSLPLTLRITAWIILTPIMLGLWIWHSSWPISGQILGFAAIVGWTAIAIYNFVKTFR